jgi:hypothetical protein
VKQDSAIGYQRAVWLAWAFLKEKRLANGIFPAHLSKWSGMTRLESEMALRALSRDDMALRREDGRFYLSNTAAEMLERQENNK